MRLFIATGIYPPESGGPATYVKLLEEKLPARGFEVTVLPFRTVRHLPKGVRHVAYFLMSIMYAAAADVVYAQDVGSVGVPAAWAAKIAGKPFVVRVPGDYAWEQGRQRFGVEDELEEFQTKRYGKQVERMRRWQKFVVRSARAVVVPSKFMERIAKSWGARECHVIYSSIEPPVHDEVAPHDGFLVVTIARPVPWKGLDGLKRVVGREEGWRLKIVNDMPRAEAMGWVAAADVFALNSTYEGLSHALVEAMTLGTPVVATRVGGTPELIEDGVTGILIPPKDDEALYRALKEVHDNPAAAHERAARARERAKDFSIDATLGTLCSMLQTL